MAEPISRDAIDGVCRSLALLSQAGLQPDDPGIPVIRRRMHLPPPPEPTAATMGLLGMRGPPVPPPGNGPPTDLNNPTPGQPPGPPDPARGEVDIEIYDLGAKPGTPLATGKRRPLSKRR